jgi:hypothetical protein
LLKRGADDALGAPDEAVLLQIILCFDQSAFWQSQLQYSVVLHLEHVLRTERFAAEAVFA